MHVDPFIIGNIGKKSFRSVFTRIWIRMVTCLDESLDIQRCNNLRCSDQKIYICVKRKHDDVSGHLYGDSYGWVSHR